VDLFDEHGLLTSASAITLQAFVAMVALALLGLAVLGATGEQHVWTKEIAPQIHPKVLPYTSAVSSLTAVYPFTTFLYVGAIALLVAIEVDAQLRRDVQGDDEQGVVTIVGDIASRARASGAR
jgi:uncharacterized BrkB/YihY/UPF0761 family membrane protein